MAFFPSLKQNFIILLKCQIAFFKFSSLIALGDMEYLFVAMRDMEYPLIALGDLEYLFVALRDMG